LYSCDDSLVVTDNRGYRNKGTGSRPTVIYQNSTSICIDNNPQPQKFDTSSVEIFHEGSSFSWMDKAGPHTVPVGDVCGINKPSPPFIDIGRTAILPQIPVGGTALYLPLSDKSIVPCLDENNQRWKFKVNNIRVPVFESVCFNQAITEGWVDLKDGLDYPLLSQHIHECKDWQLIREWLDYYIIGTHNSTNKPPKVGKYFFSPGIEKHEEQHRKDYIRKFDSLFTTNAFQKIFNRDAPKSQYSCAKSAVDAAKGDIQIDLFTSYDVGRNSNINLSAADEHASAKYIDIKKNIKWWVEYVLNIKNCK